MPIKKLRSAIFAFLLLTPLQVSAFCGFYVARADGELYNQASKVVYVRNNNRSVITMSSDYSGSASDFAMIVPTPKVLSRNQIRVVNPKTVTHLDAYSAPRLVEYRDTDPCEPPIEYLVEPMPSVDGVGRTARQRGAAALGVTIKAEYAVGDYDIAILSATQSDGLVTFLTGEGYILPDGAQFVLDDYVRMGMKFFVARVNLKRFSAGEKRDLKPLQMTFRSRDFMLPIQLGKLNGQTTQDLLVMTLTRKGRVEASNYRNIRIPSNVTVPLYVRDVFGQFYHAMFKRAAKPNTVVTEYAWDMAWCDPCAADPLSKKELKELGVNWLAPGNRNPGEDVFVTRLHLQYDQNSFPRHLAMRVTDDRENFQGRYIMNVPYDGEITCDAGREYVAQTRRNIKAQAGALHKLTNWRLSDIRRNIRASTPARYR
ncbi:MAG: DUF2330 domain-containing protein [Rhodobacterales bacterium]|nr:DUF2330 domain-containing protein [Rhodobacterales bacterium]